MQTFPPILYILCPSPIVSISTFHVTLSHFFHQDKILLSVHYNASPFIPVPKKHLNVTLILHLCWSDWSQCGGADSRSFTVIYLFVSVESWAARTGLLSLPLSELRTYQLCGVIWEDKIRSCIFMALSHRLSCSDGSDTHTQKKAQNVSVKIATVVVSLGVSSLQPFPSEGISCGRMEIGLWANAAHHSGLCAYFCPEEGSVVHLQPFLMLIMWSEMLLHFLQYTWLYTEFTYSELVLVIQSVRSVNVD